MTKLIHCRATHMHDEALQEMGKADSLTRTLICVCQRALKEHHLQQRNGLSDSIDPVCRTTTALKAHVNLRLFVTHKEADQESLIRLGYLLLQVLPFPMEEIILVCMQKGTSNSPFLYASATARALHSACLSGKAFFQALERYGDMKGLQELTLCPDFAQYSLCRHLWPHHPLSLICHRTLLMT